MDQIYRRVRQHPDRAFSLRRIGRKDTRVFRRNRRRDNRRRPGDRDEGELLRISDEMILEIVELTGLDQADGPGDLVLGDVRQRGDFLLEGPVEQDQTVAVRVLLSQDRRTVSVIPEPVLVGKNESLNTNRFRMAGDPDHLLRRQPCMVRHVLQVWPFVPAVHDRELKHAPGRRNCRRLWYGAFPAQEPENVV
mgnify:CR=1 FL=1